MKNLTIGELSTLVHIKNNALVNQSDLLTGMDSITQLDKSTALIDELLFWLENHPDTTEAVIRLNRNVLSFSDSSYDDNEKLLERMIKFQLMILA
jgi:hypothetical protein